jgi:hypothetical protein
MTSPEKKKIRVRTILIVIMSADTYPDPKTQIRKSSIGALKGFI